MPHVWLVIYICLLGSDICGVIQIPYNIPANKQGCVSFILWHQVAPLAPFQKQMWMFLLWMALALYITPQPPKLVLRQFNIRCFTVFILRILFGGESYLWRIFFAWDHTELCLGPNSIHGVRARTLIGTCKVNKNPAHCANSVALF